MLAPAICGCLTDDTGAEAKVATTVPQHAGDIPAGTLRAIERDLEIRGTSVRDVAALLGISPQRVSQLTARAS